MKFGTALPIVFALGLVGCSGGLVSELSPGPTQASIATAGSTVSLSDGGEGIVVVLADGGVSVVSVPADGGTTLAEGPLLFVSPSGKDSNDGTEAHPLLTFAHASALAKAGTTVYLRAGTFKAQEKITAVGTAAKPITFAAYPGEAVKIDGTGLGIAKTGALVLVEGAAYVTLRGIEVVNSSGRGVDVSSSSDVTVQGCTVHEIQWGALTAESDNITFDGNEVYNAVLENKGGVSSIWPSAIGTWLKADGSWVKNLTLTNNIVHDNWGECVIALFVDGTTVRGNTVHDCWSTNLYLDHVTNAVVEKNFLYATGSTYNKPSVGAPANGLGLAVEQYTTTPAVALNNIVIRNNLVVATGLGIMFWGNSGDTAAANTYENVHLENNVVYGQARAALSIDAVVSGATAPAGCTLQNNILSAGSIDGASFSIGNVSAWTRQNNDFPSGVPSAVGGSGNVAATPKFASPTTSSGPAGFVLDSGSALLSAGIATSYVKDDYWGTARPASTPAVGLYQPK